ncbi:putative protein BMH2 [Monocercomonoides exilis]|uniref:putative protein BMH2 n=1 Tax=Monocercomonoides exilis TaxID=2049356 RepID=UPI00355A2952|nr:putative protein BMH2 [Monocercomonoides exilis]|eukprot:MONOS_13535.1-p1 / transcript=MONOS_13535.1 / gene=MONOS_13535 / organism=Monocercomonoides_exilis_PA203 / gene_product=14-3-3 family protein / transcript_product=14-3-3 family protein / location=Mono_scaffold00841:18658-20680(+) / protein_length=421 / sequence_SO=supercontig / SO=protein_coding / is_pseudo=false
MGNIPEGEAGSPLPGGGFVGQPIKKPVELSPEEIEKRRQNARYLNQPIVVFDKVQAPTDELKQFWQYQIHGARSIDPSIIIQYFYQLEERRKIDISKMERNQAAIVNYVKGVYKLGSQLGDNMKDAFVEYGTALRQFLQASVSIKSDLFELQIQIGDIQQHLTEIASSLPPMISFQEKEERVYIAKLFQSSENYEEMLRVMKEIVSNCSDIGHVERTLLFTAYKYLINKYQEAWHICLNTEQYEREQFNENFARIAQEQRVKNAEKITDLCNDAVILVYKYLLPSAQPGEARVSCLTTIGDYCRYISEVTEEKIHEEAVQKSLNAYSSALEAGKKELSPIDSTFLGLVLNFSVFYFYVLGERENAISLVEEALREAEIELSTEKTDESQNAKDNEESKSLLDVIKENLGIWKSSVIDELRE